MLNQAKLERRNAPRKQLSGLLPGRLYYKEDGRALSARPVDISPNGLGILTSDEILLGSCLILQMKDLTLEFKVSWSGPDFGKKNMLRYGLACQDASCNLEELFEQKGCLK